MESKDEKRVQHLQHEIAAENRHDGWTLRGLRDELKKLLAKMKQKRKS
jgi:hypothetical protein